MNTNIRDNIYWKHMETCSDDSNNSTNGSISISNEIEDFSDYSIYIDDEIIEVLSNQILHVKI